MCTWKCCECAYFVAFCNSNTSNVTNCRFNRKSERCSIQRSGTVVCRLLNNRTHNETCAIFQLMLTWIWRFQDNVYSLLIFVFIFRNVSWKYSHIAHRWMPELDYIPTILLSWWKINWLWKWVRKIHSHFTLQCVISMARKIVTRNAWNNLSHVSMHLICGLNVVDDFIILLQRKVFTHSISTISS